MLSNKLIKEFIGELGSNAPAPGGGSAAALVAALGSALTSMVFNLTIGKKKFNELPEEKQILINQYLKENELDTKDFICFMDKDEESFLELMKTFKLPKSTEEEVIFRQHKLQEAYREALQVPLQLAKNTYKIYDYAYIASIYGNKNAISDAGVSVLMLQAALESAILNVKINLLGITDKDYKKEVDSVCDELVSRGRKKRDEILSIVNEKL